MQSYSGDAHMNIGVGSYISIKDFAELIGRVVGFQGDINFDHGRPDGTPRKLLDTSRLNALGWTPRLSLEEAVTASCSDPTVLRQVALRQVVHR